METYTIILLCLAAFFAGFVDAIVGGGGLIQTPVALILMPNLAVSSIIGSLKIPAFSGTSFAANQYLKKVDMNWKLLSIMAIVAFASAFLGSNLLTKVHNDFMKPLLLVVLTLIAIYTFTKKDFGIHQAKEHTVKRQLLLAVSMSICIGFYDGFIGPGTGSFFVLAFVVLLGFEFVQASAYAKFVNCMTNFSAVMVFVKQGNYVLSIAILMAVCNVIGNVLGSVLALKKGNAFVRIFFLLVVSAMIIRYSYMIFFS